MAVTGDSFTAISDLTSSVMKELWDVYKDAVLQDAKVVGYKRLKDNQKGEVMPQGNGVWRIRIPYLDSVNKNLGPTISDIRHKAGGSTSLNFLFESFKYDGCFGISQDVIEQTKRKDVSAVNQLTLELKNLKTGLWVDLAQDYHMDGSGAKAFLPAADNNATFTAVAPGPMLEVGHVIQILDRTTDTTERITNDDAITAVGNPTWSGGLPTTEITITDSPAATEVDDFVVISTQADGDSADSTKTGNAGTIYGLGALFDDANPQFGNWGGRDRTSTYTRLQAIIHDGSTSSAYPYIDTTYFRALSRNIMDRMFEEQGYKDGKADYILCSPAMQREYLSMTEMTTNRTPAMVKTVDAALSGPAYRGIPIVADPYCMPGRMYFFDESAVGKKEVWPIKPFPDATHGMQIATTGAFAYTYAINTRLQVVSGAPWKCAMLCDLYEDHFAEVN